MKAQTVIEMIWKVTYRFDRGLHGVFALDCVVDADSEEAAMEAARLRWGMKRVCKAFMAAVPVDATIE